MNLQELRAKRERISLEIRDLATKDNITDGESIHLERLTNGLQNVGAEIEEIEARAARIELAKATITERASGVDTFQIMRTTTTRDIFENDSHDSRDRTYNALKALDITADASASELKPELRSLIERNGEFAEHFRSTADPSYLSAVSKLIGYGDASRALMAMTDGERASMQRVSASEARAAALSPTSAGGFASPQLLDPAIVIQNAGSTNPIRQISRVVTGVGDKWQGITSAGITSSWDGEGVAVSDDSPTLAQPTITSHKVQTFVPFSIEIQDDWVGFALDMARLIGDSRDRLESAAFTNGTGSGQPYGIVTRLDANTNVEVVVTTDGAFGSVDCLKVFAQLGSRYRENATWIMSLDALNEVRSFSNSTALGAQIVDMQSTYNFNLLGRPVRESSDMPDFTGTTGASNICVVGDFQNFIIFDRVASARIELVSHLFDVTNNRPTGQRGLYAYARTGADLMSPTGADNGFKLLQNQ